MELREWANHKLWASVRGDFLDWCEANNYRQSEEPWRLYATYARWARAQAAKRAAEKVRDNKGRTRRASASSGRYRRGR